MRRWKCVQKKGREYTLCEDLGIEVFLSPSSTVDVRAVVDQLNELNIPSSFAFALEEVYFTRLRNRDHGDYLKGRIRLSSNAVTQSIMGQVIVHELAHHVDELFCLSSDEKLVKEKKLRWKYLPDPYAKKDVSEYLAVGFETYYCGSLRQRVEMKQKNPVLYEIISSTHNFFHRWSP